MTVYTKDNYRQHHGQGKDFTVSFDPPKRPARSYFEETCLVAEAVYAQRTAPLHLMYSGGLDSEYALAIFRHLKIPIRPVIMQTQYNQHDIAWAYKYCEQHSIEYTRVDLDYDWFVESGTMQTIAETAETGTIGCLANLWLTTQIDGTVITGDAPPHLSLNKDTGLWMMDELEYESSQWRYWTKMKTLGTPYFMCYTAEQMMSFLLDPAIVELVKNQRPGKLGSNSSKVDVYNRHNTFALEQRPKYHGMETVEQSKIYQHPTCRLIESWTEKWGGYYEQEYHTFMQKFAHNEELYYEQFK